MKYRYRITSEGTVEADSETEARKLAFEKLDAGEGLYGVEVEPLREANEACTKP